MPFRPPATTASRRHLPMLQPIPNSTRWSRRRFLRCAAQTAAVGIGLPTLIPRRTMAGGGQPGANDRIGVGIIGIGRQAGDLLKNLLTLPEARYVAVADVNLARARESAALHGAEPCQDYRALLERKDVDAVITATPDHWRALVCIHACQAGKDVYAEKPLSLTIREGRLMARAARRYSRVFQVGSQQRSMWINQAACEFVRKGGLGAIRQVYASNYPSPWECGLPAEPVPAGLDWAAWCGPAGPEPYNKDLYLPRARPGWISFRPYSGGEMTGWGAHGFDMIQAALGMDQAGPVEVWTEGPAYNPPRYTSPESRDRGEKVCSLPKVLFRYPGDIRMEMVDLDPDGRKPPPAGGTFIGAKGTMSVDRGRISSEPEDLAFAIMKRRPAGLKDNHLANWLDCVRTRKHPNADVEIGHRSATVCHLGNIARWTGRRLKWDPVKEQFRGDSSANEYLDRQRHQPWELPSAV
jgi:predicted dehydrogenase